MGWTARIAWIGAIAAGCGGDAGSSTATGDAPTFAEIRDEILVPSCGFSSCHGSGTGDLTISADGDVYAALVDVPSVGSPGETLVVPGDPDASYLVAKLEGAAGIEGDPMPAPSGLDPAEVDRIRAWIAAGAAP
ncbi:MAG: hypothetical protein ABMB14_33265 [Myxococcota bacterium]